MLDVLPTELLTAILLDSVAFSPHAERRRALYSYCLVSKRTRVIAQPLLWQRIEIKRSHQVSSVVAGARKKRRGGNARTLVIEEKEKPWKPIQVQEVVQALSKLEEVKASGGMVWKTAELKGLADLRRLQFLHLESTTIRARPASFRMVFASLVSLTLSNVRFSLCEPNDLLQPTSFPNLRILRLEELRCSNSHFSCSINLRPALLDQLDLLDIFQDDLSHLSYSVVTSSMLVFCRTRDLDNAVPDELARDGPVEHIIPGLDLEQSWHTDRKWMLRNFRGYVTSLHELVDRPNLGVRSVWLPPSFRPERIAALDGDTVDLACKMKRLLDECAARNPPVRIEFWTDEEDRDHEGPAAMARLQRFAQEWKAERKAVQGAKEQDQE
ncbi:hypothetical protein JCM8097_006622 [Rhodosporidiobolus ruineniae]